MKEKSSPQPRSVTETATLESERLFALAREKSRESRAELGEAVASLFDQSPKGLTDKERELISDILHRLFHQMEISVRARLSSTLAGADDAPRDLVRFLANEDIEIAYPILLHSKVLMDEDLIEVIRQKTQEHQLAVAMRNGLNAEVSDALVETKRENVIVELLHNTTAKISKATTAYLAEESRTTASYCEPLLHRRELDVELARKMHVWVSAALRRYIIENWNIDQVSIDQGIESALKGSVASLQTGQKVESSADVLARQIVHEQENPIHYLLKSLADGEITLFISLFRVMTGLRKVLVRRILFEPGGEGLAILCKSLSMEPSDFEELFRLSRLARRGTDASQAKAHEQLLKDTMTFYDTITIPAARNVVQRWAYGSDYLAAVRDIEFAFGL